MTLFCINIFDFQTNEFKTDFHTKKKIWYGLARKYCFFNFAAYYGNFYRNAEMQLCVLFNLSHN